ncbi:MAG: hypothetical protein V4733_09225 [Verrucomicrobiota bacterium]
MKYPIESIRKAPPGKPGFALVITLSLMMLLALVAMALLSLAAITTRSSQGTGVSVARANARMALILAIGDLQKHTGPDRRVTANASLVNADIDNPQWVGVWRTDGFKSDPAGGRIILPDTQGGTGYSDRRAALSTPYNALSESLSWLVSGSPAGPDQAPPTGTVMEIVRSDTGDTGDPDDPEDSSIRVPRVSVSGKNAGSYGYFISDESQKAKLNISDPHVAEQPDASDAAGEGMRRWTAPPCYDPTVFIAGSETSETDAAKTTDFAQMELSTLRGSMSPEDLRAYIKEHGDQFTTYGRSLLADSANGGLKRDLTSYLEANTAPALGLIAGITDTTSINFELGASRGTSAPKFGLLRNWYNLRTEITKSGDEYEVDTEVPPTQTMGTPTSPAIVSPENFTAPMLQPVLAEAVCYFRYVLEADAPDDLGILNGTVKMKELCYPRIVLWNPYAVTLKTKGHLVYFDIFACRSIHVVPNPRPKPTDPPDPLLPTDQYIKSIGFVSFPGWVSNQAPSPEHLNNRPGFFIPESEIAPGEARVFCAPRKDLSYSVTNLRENVLSSEVSPSDMGFFTRPDWENCTIKTPVRYSSIKFELRPGWNEMFYGRNTRNQTVTLHDVSGASNAITGSGLMSGSHPAVRQMSLDNFSRGNNGRTPPFITLSHPDAQYPGLQLKSAVMSQNIPPDTLTCLGGRFRFLYETRSNREHGRNPGRQPWYFAPLAHHNINAPNIHRWPSDNVFGMTYLPGQETGENTVDEQGLSVGYHLYSYGLLSQARQWTGWTSAESMPHLSLEGHYRTSVFGDAVLSDAYTTYPVYDLPLPGAPVASLGYLQNAPVSPYVWHPTHVIGNSIPSPFLLSGNFTARSTTQELALWSNSVVHLSPARTPALSKDITGFNSFSNQNLFSDVSYELNEALWDRYFLSTFPKSTVSGNWDLDTPLPNPRLRIDPIRSLGGSSAILGDFHKAASGLSLDGGFNVNSTNVDAWKSLLRSFRQVSIPAREPYPVVPQEDGAAFPGFLIAQGESITAASNAEQKEFWRNFRMLTDAEIDLLAVGIVAEIRKRGPFIGLADFVNRRLSTDPNAPAAFGGTIQTAINGVTAINDDGNSNPDYRLPSADPPGDAGSSYSYGNTDARWQGGITNPSPQNYRVFHRIPNGELRQKGDGAASHITQADVLQQIGSVLTARGDTFVVRAFGDARDASGNLVARAWCEAVVQRTPDPINPDPATDGINPLIQPGKTDWGRRYVIESFRWLHPSEI